MESRPLARLAPARRSAPPPACRRWCATSTASIATCRRCTSATATGAASSGSSPTMPTATSSRGCAKARRARPLAVVVANFSPNVPSTITAFGVPLAGHVPRSCSTPTPPHYGGSNVGNVGAVEVRGRLRCHGRRPQSLPSRCRRWPSSSSLRREDRHERTAIAHRPGKPYPLGATWDGAGINFALFSAHAERVELCIFDSQGRREIERFALPEYTDEVWHGYLTEFRPGSSTAIASTARTSRSTATASTTTSCCSIPMPSGSPAGCAGATRISATASAARATTLASTGATTRAACRKPSSSTRPSTGAGAKCRPTSRGRTPSSTRRTSRG